MTPRTTQSGTPTQAFAPKVQAASTVQGGPAQRAYAQHTIRQPSTQEPSVAQPPRRTVSPTIFTPGTRTPSAARTTDRRVGTTPTYTTTSNGGGGSAPEGYEPLPLFDEEEDARARAGLDPVDTTTDTVDEGGQGTSRTLELGFGIVGGLAVGLAAMWFIRR